MRPFALALLLVALIATPAPTPANASDCQFVLGFKLLGDLIPNIVGDCLVNQHYNPENGDALQETTGGLLVWRKADNRTLFTDGYRTWMSMGGHTIQRLNTEQWPWEATPATPPTPPAPATAPGPYIVRQYPQVLSDCYVYMVSEWSDGNYTKEKLRPPTPAEANIVACRPAPTPSVQQPPAAPTLPPPQGPSPPSPVLSVCSPAIESRIDGEFEGWDGDTVFRLVNGQIWLQSEYSYWYHYAYMPRVLIYNASGGCRMSVEGSSKSIRVERLR